MSCNVRIQKQQVELKIGPQGEEVDQGGGAVTVGIPSLVKVCAIWQATQQNAPAADEEEVAAVFSSSLERKEGRQDWKRAGGNPFCYSFR